MAIKDLFNCTNSDERFLVLKTGSTIIEEKIKLYNQAIESSIINLKNTLINIKDYFGDGSDLEGTDYYNYQNLLSAIEYLNSDKFTHYTDEIIDFQPFFVDVAMKYNKSFGEVYMMARQIKKYECCLPDAYDVSLDLFGTYVVSGILMCEYDNATGVFIDNIDALTDYVFYHDIPEGTDISYDDAMHQRLSNTNGLLNTLAIHEASYALDTAAFKNNLHYFLLYSDQLINDIRLAVKVIGLVNIVMTSPDDDVSRLQGMSLALTSYNNSPEDPTDLTDLEKYNAYNAKQEEYISKITIPISIGYREILDDDWGNYNQITTQAVIASFNGTGLNLHCSALLRSLGLEVK